MASMTAKHPDSAEAALSIDVEDWFHTDCLKGVIAREAWEGCELRVERNTMRMMEILDARKARATFFVLGWVAEKCPDLVRTIAAAGHGWRLTGMVTSMSTRSGPASSGQTSCGQSDTSRT
jgi:hypothetical protein